MLLDTDVMVDILRGHPPAATWLAGSSAIPIGLPGLVAMELLQGCRNLAEQHRLEKQLLRFALYWPPKLTASAPSRTSRPFGSATAWACSMR